MKIVVFLLVIAIVVVLLRALVQLVRGPSGSPQLARSLTWRVALSITLFVALIAASHMGWL
ncbi:twin transmembrane helix small protein [Chitinibacteraceae bacterium HSL-7]